VTVRRVLVPLAESIAVHLGGSVAGDVEALHDLRIAVRRSRSVVTHSGNLLPPAVREPARRELRQLAASSGPVRDLDVHLQGWDAQVAGIDGVDPAAMDEVRQVLERRRDAARADLIEVLQRPSTVEWLSGWRAWLEDPRIPLDDRVRTGPFVADRLKRAQRRVLRHGRAIDDASPPDALHRLRKDAKALRYLLDCYRPLLDQRGAKHVTARLRSLQDVLGAHQDGAVQITLYTWLESELRAPTGGGGSSAATGAAALLREDARRRMGLHRAEFAARFATYDTRPNRRSLNELLRPLGRR
jgi:CHAD domain-containing protein